MVKYLGVNVVGHHWISLRLAIGIFYGIYFYNQLSIAAFTEKQILSGHLTAYTRWNTIKCASNIHILGTTSNGEISI